MKIYKIAAAALISSVAFASSAIADGQIKIVGSSTVFPFTTAVAENFGRSNDFKTPVVESTGTGGGMKLFCAGVGRQTPDFANASRAIKEKELKRCHQNGVTPVEIKVGFDGIVIANSKAGQHFSISKLQIFLALAKFVPNSEGKLIPNPNKKWSDVDSALPPVKIEVLGPPPTSGTRDAFSELALEGGAKKVAILKELRGLKAGDPRIGEIVTTLGLDKSVMMVGKKLLKGMSFFKKIAHDVREDGAYIEAGENDNLIVQKLQANKNALGVFGFSFLDQNTDKLQGSRVGGIEPTFENIAAGDYGISRSLFIYAKKEHVGVVSGMAEFIAEYTDEETWGEEGYLADKGLIPMPLEERQKVAADAKNLVGVSM